MPGRGGGAGGCIPRALIKSAIVIYTSLVGLRKDFHKITFKHILYETVRVDIHGQTDIAFSVLKMRTCRHAF